MGSFAKHRSPTGCPESLGGLQAASSIRGRCGGVGRSRIQNNYSDASVNLQAASDASAVFTKVTVCENARVAGAIKS